MITYIILAMSFVCMVLPYQVAAKKRCNGLLDTLSHRCDLDHLNDRHFASMIAMLSGICLYSLVDQAFITSFPSIWQPLLPTIPVLVISFLFRHVLSKARTNFIQAPWPVSEYLIIRIIFLAVYEIYFRGLLLTVSTIHFGATPGIIINIFLYCVAHIYSSKTEILGSIPLGAVLCMVTINTGSIWPAILIHLFIAIPFEIILFLKYKLKTKSK